MTISVKSTGIFMLIVIGFFLAVVPAFSAQQAVIKEMSGKVELKSQGGSWTPATTGATVSRGTVISTGFNSSAVLDLGKSVINVKALTRMTLEELVEEKGMVRTELFLDVGRVRADIKSSEGVAHDFKIKSTVSTASVRGTVIEGDGEEWASEEGSFVVTNNTGQSTTVSTGQQTTVTGNAPPSDPQDELENDTNVPTNTNPSGGGTITLPPLIPDADPTMTNITIEVEWRE
jgi:hypothetical protein